MIQAAPGMIDESTSKDEFFERVGFLAESMIEKFGRDFAMGVLILATRFIAEGRSLTSLPSQGETSGTQTARERDIAQNPGPERPRKTAD
jgi:hypothetical protein